MLFRSPAWSTAAQIGVIQPLSEIASRSFALLQNMIEDKVSEEEKTSLLKVKLVLGGRFGGESTEASF